MWEFSLILVNLWENRFIREARREQDTIYVSMAIPYARNDGGLNKGRSSKRDK